PNPCGCVEGAEGKPAGKKGANVCSRASSSEWPDVRRDRHPLIVPGRQAQPSPTLATVQAHTSGELMTDQYRSVWSDQPESTQPPGRSSAAAEPGYPPLPGHLVPANWGRRVR